MNRLRGKVAVVTGASKGIGAAIAEYMGAEGAPSSSTTPRASPAPTPSSSVSRNGRARPSRSRPTWRNRRTSGTFLPKRKKPSASSTFSSTTRASTSSAPGLDHRGTFPQAVQRQCARPAPGHAGGCEALRPRRRQHRQHQFHRGDAGRAGQFRIQRHQGRRGRHHQVAGQGTGATQDPRQRHQPRHGRNRRAHSAGSPRAISASKSRPKRRSAESASRKTLPRPRSSSRRRKPAGSPAKRSTIRRPALRFLTRRSRNFTERARVR